MSHQNIEQLTNGIFLVTDESGQESIVTDTEILLGITKWPERVWHGNTVDCDDYYERHAVCPNCGGDGGDMMQTCMGPLCGQDRNHCVCQCGWRGIVHDLVPAGVKQDG